MARVQWSRVALDDLFEISDYIAKDSPVYAASFVRDARVLAQSLKEFPQRGRTVPEFNRDELREVILRPYRVVYQVDEQLVTILAVIHGARDMRSAWKSKRRSP